MENRLRTLIATSCPQDIKCKLNLKTGARAMAQAVEHFAFYVLS